MSYVEFVVSGRQSGKTQRCIEMYKEMLKYDKNAIYLTFSYNEVDRLTRLLYRYSSGYTVSNNIRSFVHGKHRNVVIDEYLLYSKEHQMMIDGFVSGNDIEHVYVQTTSNMLYDKGLLSLITELRYKNVNPMKLRNYLDDESLQELDMLSNNLLTNPKTSLKTKEDVTRKLSRERYKREILGLLFDE